MIELLERSTIHGINHIASTRNKIFKSIWILLFFGGLVGILVNSTFVVMKFMTRPVASNIHLNYEPFIWPDLTFCNPTAPYALTDKSVYNTWINGLKNASPIAQSLMKTTFRTKYYYIEKALEVAERAVTMATLDPRHLKLHHTENYFRIFGYAKSQFGINYFNELQIEGDYLFSYGTMNPFTTQTVLSIPCHTVHVDKLRPEHQNLTKSLEVTIYSHDMDYKLFNSSETSRKIWLHVSDKNELPQRKPIILLPGYITLIQLSQTRKLHNQWKRTCWNASIFSEAEIVNNTNCIYDRLRSDLHEIYNKRCKKYEPVKCDEIVYSITMERERFFELKANIRRRVHIKRLFRVDDDSYRDMTKTFALLVIERENDYYDLYEEYFMYPFSELLSDIGGLMGLWMGMSIVGLFELVQYFYFYFHCDKIRRRGQHEAIQRQEQEDNLQREL